MVTHVADVSHNRCSTSKESVQSLGLEAVEHTKHRLVACSVALHLTQRALLSPGRQRLKDLKFQSELHSRELLNRLDAV